MKKEVKVVLILLGLMLAFYFLNLISYTGFLTVVTNVSQPAFSLFYPKGNINVTSQNITFSGLAAYADVLYTKLNNKANEITLLSNPDFVKTFTLDEGKNTIALYVCKNENCSSTKTLTIYYNSTITLNQTNQTILPPSPLVQPSQNNIVNQTENIPPPQSIAPPSNTDMANDTNEEPKETSNDPKIIIWLVKILKKILFID